MIAIAKRISIEKHGIPSLRPLLTGVCVLCLATPLLTAQVQGGGAYFLSGNTKAGMQTFFDKGCARCHAVLGEGGRAAPDLARAPGGNLSAAELVAGMWNHAPAMWEKMRLQRLAPPKFSEEEMTNLFAFLYSVRALDEPGDAERGRRLVAEKRCLECHSLAGQGGRAGPDLRSWASYRNPVSWIQAMWNHAQPMQAMMAARGLSWPQFLGNDMTDLMAYIRTLAANSKGHVYLRQANAETGRELFRQKGCVSCHAIRGAGGSRAPDLGRRALPRTLGQLAGLMWNHAPAMWASMRAQQVPRPQFSNQEMADLIAYLFAERYFEMAGNAERGRRRFEEKGCAGCHTAGAKADTAPDLAGWRGGGSPIPVATALWNHGPLMLEKMRQQEIPWPRFRPGEIVDLLEFLNRGQFSPALAKAKP
ncbi:MAG: c-type cytochrome [Acidobacteria bacterium]|nr:c-type cytochrome [Acidobacteriota bacterium]